MKKMIAILAGLALLMAAPLALAEGEATLTVTGTGVVTLTPDYVTLNLGVNTQAETVTAAQEKNAALMNALVDALMARGIAKEDIQTNYFSINPVYDYGSMSIASDTPMGYRVDNSLLVIVRDLNAVSQTLDAAVKAGANQSYGLTFESTQKAAAYDQALKNAAAEAARKAGVLAEASGKSLGDLQKMAEQTGGYRGEYASILNMADSGRGAPIMSGTLSVEASVEMTYSLK